MAAEGAVQRKIEWEKEKQGVVPCAVLLELWRTEMWREPRLGEKVEGCGGKEWSCVRAAFTLSMILRGKVKYIWSWPALSIYLLPPYHTCLTVVQALLPMCVVSW